MSSHCITQKWQTHSCAILSLEDEQWRTVGNSVRLQLNAAAGLKILNLWQKVCGGDVSQAQLEGAVLPSQNVIHFIFPFRLEEDVDEDGHHCQEAGYRHRAHHQPCKRCVCKEKHKGK